MTTVGADPTVEMSSPEGGTPADLTTRKSPLRTDLGHTIIAPRVAEKIARQAARQTAGVCGAEASGLSRLLPRAQGSPSATAGVAIGVDDDSVAVDLTISVRYPEPVSDVTRRAREHVVERLTTCTGLRVTSVDILVTSLVAGGPVARRVR